MMTYALPLDHEVGENFLAWHAPPSLEFPREAVEYFREDVERLQMGDPGAALTALSRSTDIAPTFGEAHVFLGLANALSCNIYPAIDHLELAARLQPESFAAHYTLAQSTSSCASPRKDTPLPNRHCAV